MTAEWRDGVIRDVTYSLGDYRFGYVWRKFIRPRYVVSVVNIACDSGHLGVLSRGIFDY